MDVNAQSDLQSVTAAAAAAATIRYASACSTRRGRCPAVALSRYDDGYLYFMMGVVIYHSRNLQRCIAAARESSSG
eukprot:6210973-Pleurochrysis_carterae.AAC.3